MKYQVFGILWTVFNLALMLVMSIVGIYLLWLVIKALRVYINSHEVREEKKATRKSYPSLFCQLPMDGLDGYR